MVDAQQLAVLSFQPNFCDQLMFNGFFFTNENPRKFVEKQKDDTGCPRKQFTLFDNALILKLFIAQVRYYTHFEADIASFKMSTHTLHRCQQKPSNNQISLKDENQKCTKIDNFLKDSKAQMNETIPHTPTDAVQLFIIVRKRDQEMLKIRPL